MRQMQLRMAFIGREEEALHMILLKIKSKRFGFFGFFGFLGFLGFLYFVFKEPFFYFF